MEEANSFRFFSHEMNDVFGSENDSPNYLDLDELSHINQYHGFSDIFSNNTANSTVSNNNNNYYDSNWQYSSISNGNNNNQIAQQQETGTFCSDTNDNHNNYDNNNFIEETVSSPPIITTWSNNNNKNKNNNNNMNAMRYESESYGNNRSHYDSISNVSPNIYANFSDKNFEDEFDRFNHDYYSDHNIYSYDSHSALLNNNNNNKIEQIACIPPMFASLPPIMNNNNNMNNIQYESQSYHESQPLLMANNNNNNNCDQQQYGEQHEEESSYFNQRTPQTLQIYDDDNKTVTTQQMIETIKNRKNENKKQNKKNSKKTIRKSKKRKLNEMDNDNDNDNDYDKEPTSKKRKLSSANKYISVTISRQESNKRFKEYMIANELINDKNLHCCNINGCNKSFASRPHLKRHVLEIHIGRRYECRFPECEQNKNGINWKQKSQCKEHVINKHYKASKPWKCYLCSSTFTRYGGVKRHLQLIRCIILKNNYSKNQQNQIISNTENDLYKTLCRV